jgi:lipoate-protein ligase B
MSDIEFIRLPGLVPYAEGLRVQQARRGAVERGVAPEAVFLLEHAPVITLGRKWCPENLLHTRDQYAEMGIDVCETDRGGDVTYHGPGQMVAYPILKLDSAPNRKPSIQWYLRALEEVLIQQLARYGLQAGRCEGLTGVWVGDAKIAAIGVRIHNWTTSHGIALNINPDMAHFRLIIPCGIADKPVTLLKQLLGDDTPSMTAITEDFERAFEEIFSHKERKDLKE